DLLPAATTQDRLATGFLRQTLSNREGGAEPEEFRVKQVVDRTEMVGTAGLPHVIVRFFTVPKFSDARRSAGWALLFIAALYTTAPAVAAFARLNLVETVQDTSYQQTPEWLRNWEDIGLIGWWDKNGDGRIQYGAGEPFEGAPEFDEGRGLHGQRLIANPPTDSANELYVDRDIMVLANPEIAQLPGWVIALVAAGGLAAALSTAAGLLLVISSSVSHDLLKKTLLSNVSEKQELRYARLSAAAAVVLAGYFGINPPAFVAQVVAFAFGLAAASIFPALLLGIFVRKMNKEGAIAGMLAGLGFTWLYIAYFKFWAPQLNTPENWWFGISPEGIGFIGMLLNFAVALTVMRFTAPPPAEVEQLVTSIREPTG
ncbi:MAG: VC_2705 family sodium/solute symporter, partial [Alphaproteobacteria bacterium]|nr:VC_2705 family sodium/solute symporter [Alphaproteobacteria bacterium]